MNESIVMKISTALLVISVAWIFGSVSTLQGGHREQEVHIQSGIDDLDKIQGILGEHGERITRLESGMGAKLDSLIEKVDGISSKLERLERQ